MASIYSLRMNKFMFSSPVSYLKCKEKKSSQFTLTFFLAFTPFPLIIYWLILFRRLFKKKCKRSAFSAACRVFKPDDAQWKTHSPPGGTLTHLFPSLQRRRSTYRRGGVRRGLPLMDRGSVPEKEEVFNDCQGGGGTLSVNQS